MAEQEKRSEKQKLLDAIKVSPSLCPSLTYTSPSPLISVQSRGIHLAGDTNEEGLPHELSLQGPHPSGERVHFDTEGNLVWPVLFLYPEYGQTDFIAAFSEYHK